MPHPTGRSASFSLLVSAWQPTKCTPRFKSPLPANADPSRPTTVATASCTGRKQRHQSVADGEAAAKAHTREGYPSNLGEGRHGHEHSRDSRAAASEIRRRGGARTRVCFVSLIYTLPMVPHCVFLQLLASAREGYPNAGRKRREGWAVRTPAHAASCRQRAHARSGSGHAPNIVWDLKTETLKRSRCKLYRSSKFILQDQMYFPVIRRKWTQVERVGLVASGG